MRYADNADDSRSTRTITDRPQHDIKLLDHDVETREYPAHCQKPLTYQISDIEKSQSLVNLQQPTVATLTLNIKASAKSYWDFVQTLVHLARMRSVDGKRIVRLKISIKA